MCCEHGTFMLKAVDLLVEVAGVPVVNGGSFEVRARQTVGLVGRNGAGKTSMLKVLAGQMPAAKGSVKITGGLGYLPQDPKVDDLGRTALTHVLSGRGFDEDMVRIEKLRLALEEDPSEENIAKFSRAQERFEVSGGYAADSEVRRLSDGLGLADNRLELPVSALSGGERRRVELARILFAGSDVLLLDEPTNHLDIDAKEWLLDFMRGYSGALIVISHDLELLDEAITRIIHLERPDDLGAGSLTEYKGTYSQYLKSRVLDEQRLTKVATQQANEINRLSTLADSMRGQTATRARKAKSLDTRVAKMEEHRIDAPKAVKSVKVTFPDPPHCGRTVVEAKGLAKSYDDLDVFADVDFDLGRGERMLVLGLNGAGKTSLLRILAGQIEADLGTFEWGHQVSPGYFAQEHEMLDDHRDLISQLRGAAPDVDDVTLRAMLGGFGLVGDKVYQEAGTLSGGEKTKLALTLLVAGRHNVLLLDEPTNNLDPPSRDAAAASLAAWKGAVILVSHDTDFVSHLDLDKVLIMPEGTIDYWREDHMELVELA